MWRTALAYIFVTSTICGQTAPDDRDVSWKTLVPNILEDQKDIWTFPARLVHGNDFLPTIAFAGVSAGVILLADPPEAHYFRNASTFNGFNRVFSSNATAIGTALVPASFLLVGIARKNEKAKKTALFSGEAVADAEILATVLKQATNRARPLDIPPNSGFGDSWSEGHKRIVSNAGSFPSGHAIAAFSVATIVARQYPHHRWLPYVAYGGAALVGFSRMTLSAHFASDVLAGAVFGYAISRFSVLHQY